MFFNQGTLRVEQLFAIATFLVHVFNSLGFYGVGLAARIVGFCRVHGLDRIAAITCRFAADATVALLRLAKPGRGGHAEIDVDDFLHVFCHLP